MKDLGVVHLAAASTHSGFGPFQFGDSMGVRPSRIRLLDFGPRTLRSRVPSRIPRKKSPSNFLEFTALELSAQKIHGQQGHRTRTA